MNEQIFKTYFCRKGRVDALSFFHPTFYLYRLPNFHCSKFIVRKSGFFHLLFFIFSDPEILSNRKCNCYSSSSCGSAIRPPSTNGTSTFKAENVVFSRPSTIRNPACFENDNANFTGNIPPATSKFPETSGS